MFGSRVLCVIAAFAYAAASLKPLTIISLIDNEPMTKKGRFGSEEGDRVEEFKAEIVTPRLKIWNSENMVLHVINKALRWEANSDSEGALWTYVPVSNDGGMLSGKGGLCLFRDEDMVSLKECPENPSSLVSEYMFKLDIETNPNDLKMCERVVVENQEEKARKREAGDAKSQVGGGTGIKDRNTALSRERRSPESKRGVREDADRDRAPDIGGRRREPKYPREGGRRGYDNKDSTSEYSRQRESDRDVQAEPPSTYRYPERDSRGGKYDSRQRESDRDVQAEPPSTYRYPERDSRGGKYAERPRFAEREPPEDIGRGDFGSPERDSRYFDKDFQGENGGRSNFIRGGGGGYRGGARDREMPREPSRDYSRQGTSALCRDDPRFCGLVPESSRKPQQGNTLDENALSTLIQLIKKFQQERLSNSSGTQHA